MPDLLQDRDYVLAHGDQMHSVTSEDTYMVATTIRQKSSDGAHEVITGSRTIIDDILLWKNGQSVVLLMFEFMYRVLMKYHISLKIKKCNFFSDWFEYMGRDITTTGNATAQSKYDLVKNWERPATGDMLHSFASFCNFYSWFVPMFQIQCKSLRDLYLRCGKGRIPDMAWTPQILAIFENLKSAITSSPLLVQYDSTKPIFLKTD